MGLEKILNNAGNFLHNLFSKKDSRLEKEEEEKLVKNLDELKSSVHSTNIENFQESLMRCVGYMGWLDNKKHGDRRVREDMGKRFSEAINYCSLYKAIEYSNNSLEIRTTIIDLPKYPKAHALIIGKDKITDLEIHFDYYSLMQRDKLPWGLVQAKPNLSRHEMEWEGDIGQIIEMINCYRKDNTVMLITGDHDECPAKKEFDASAKFTIIYTDYLKTKQFVESHRDLFNFLKTKDF